MLCAIGVWQNPVDIAELSAGSFMVYQNAATNADVKAEQNNVQTLAANADRVYGSLGSYQNVTTARTVADDADDEATEDLMIKRLQVHEKNAWMLRSLLQ